MILLAKQKYLLQSAEEVFETSASVLELGKTNGYHSSMLLVQNLCASCTYHLDWHAFVVPDADTRQRFQGHKYFASFLKHCHHLSHTCEELLCILESDLKFGTPNDKDKAIFYFWHNSKLNIVISK